MHGTVDISHVYLHEDGPTAIPCRQCGISQPLPLAQDLPEALGRELLQLRCQACASIVYVRCECRRYPRLSVNLLGTLVRRHPHVNSGPVKIISLSMGGLGFVSPTALPLTMGEVCDIHFVLNDGQHSKLHEAITIRRIQGPVVGAEFADQDQYRYALDFYISAQRGTDA